MNPRKLQREFIKASRLLKVNADVVYEFGSCRVYDDDLRELFPNSKYTGCDIQAGPGVDEIKNVMDIKLCGGSADMILCMSTLEHVPEPIRAVHQMYRVLKEPGIMLISSVFDFRIHAHPDDYWRFTPSAFKYIMKQFTASRVYWEGPENKPRYLFGIGTKGINIPIMFQRKMDSIMYRHQFDLWQKRWDFIPPIIRRGLYKLKGI